MPTEGGDAPSDPKLITRVVARNLKSLAEHGVGAFTPHDLRRTCRTGLALDQWAAHLTGVQNSGS